MSAEHEEWMVAVHEAGHAVVAVVAGMDVKHVVLHRAGAVQGEAGRCELRDVIGEIDADLGRFLIYVFSGAAAETRATGHTSLRDAGDRAYAVKVAALRLEMEPTARLVVETVEIAEVIANTRMQDHPVIWKWVQTVAKALVKHRRLTGRDVFELRPEEARR